MAKALELQDLSKSYTLRKKQPGLWGAIKGLVAYESKTVEALKSLSLGIEQGEAVGLIGENGAGKSTTMKLCTGILKPTGGELRVLGHQPWRERRRLAIKIGVVFGQRPQLLWDIAVRETFSLNQVMYRVPQATFDATFALCDKMLELKPLLDQPVRQLSLGQRMRCDLACAFLHAPQLVFLDEPTIGLDVLAKEQARGLIKAMRKRFGTTMVLTTHDLKDISDTCRRVVLLDKGRLLFDGSMPEFEAAYASEQRVLVSLDEPLKASARAALKAPLLRAGGRLLKGGALEVNVAFEKKSAARGITQLLMKKLKVADIGFEKTEMEAVVRKIYSKQGSGRG